MYYEHLQTTNHNYKSLEENMSILIIPWKENIMCALEDYYILLYCIK